MYPVETYPLISIHSTAKVADAAKLMADCGMGAVGVVDKEHKFIGIFTERDLADFVGRGCDSNAVLLAAVVNDFPVVVDGPLSPGEAAEHMSRSRIRHLIVKEADEYRIVSMRDLFSPPLATTRTRD